MCTYIDKLMSDMVRKTGLNRWSQTEKALEWKTQEAVRPSSHPAFMNEKSRRSESMRREKDTTGGKTT